MYNLLKEDYVRCVWPDAVLPLGKNGNYLVAFFKEKYDINIEYLEETKTVTGRGPKSNKIHQIFNVYNDSLDRFKEIKEKIGAEFAEDVVRRKEHHLYNERIYLNYFKRFESKLMKEGVLTKEDQYKSKLGY